MKTVRVTRAKVRASTARLVGGLADYHRTPRQQALERMRCLFAIKQEAGFLRQMYCADGRLMAEARTAIALADALPEYTFGLLAEGAE